MPGIYVPCAGEEEFIERLRSLGPQRIYGGSEGELCKERLHARKGDDELRQGIRDIAFISDPDAGELTIGCPESIAAGFLIPVLERFSNDHPRVRVHVLPVRTPTVELPELLERRIDPTFARFATSPVKDRLSEELDAEVLFNDQYRVVVGAKSSGLGARSNFRT
jgi:DNA-binding transcriptional LysR family regulator